MRNLIFITLLSLGFLSSIYGQVSESCIETYSTIELYNPDFSNLGGVILYDNPLSSSICDGEFINETGELITIDMFSYEGFHIDVHYPDLSQVQLYVVIPNLNFQCDATFSESFCNPFTGGLTTNTQYQFNYTSLSVEMYLDYDWYQDEPEGNWQLMVAESLLNLDDINLNISPQWSEEHQVRVYETIPQVYSTISDILYTLMLNAIEEFVIPEIEDSSPDCHEWCSIYGLVYDECGICNGSGIPDGDCDCDGNILDECGVCGGSGIAEGDCDCDGNQLDECGVCGGGNISCSGCTNDTATNYDSTATIEDGTCLYDQVAYDVAIALCPECINEDQIDEGFSCIEIWEPVCGCNDVTYSNDCYAYYNGVTEWTDGECESLNPYNPDFDNDEIIGVNDLLALLSVFGSPFNSNAVCGNGIVEDGEDCDDGNDIPGDGCDGCMFDGIIQE